MVKWLFHALKFQINLTINERAKYMNTVFLPCKICVYIEPDNKTEQLK